MIGDAVVVVVKLTSHVPAVVLLKPVRESVVVVVGINHVGQTIVIVVVPPNSDYAIDFVDVEDVIVVIVRVDTVV